MTSGPMTTAGAPAQGVTVAFSDNDISNFLTAMVETGGLHMVTKDADKLICYASSNKPVTIQVGEQQIPLAIYGTKNGNTAIINPFSEGAADNNRNWYYHTRNLILSCTIIAVMKNILVSALEHAKKKKDDDRSDLRLLEIISPYVKVVDEKMVKEFENISAVSEDFLNVYYNRRERATELKALIFNQEQRKAYPSVRVKSWETFENVLGDILGTKDLHTFYFKSASVGCPQFESHTRVLLRIYAAIADYMQLIGKTVDTATLEMHMQYFDQYYQKSRWCSSASSPLAPEGPKQVAASTVPTSTVPWDTGVPTTMSNVPMVGYQQGVMMPQQMVVPTAVPTFNSGVPMMPGYNMMQPQQLQFGVPQQMGMVPMMPGYNMMQAQGVQMGAMYPQQAGMFPGAPQPQNINAAVAQNPLALG